MPDLALRLCARRFGVGSDGLLVLEPSEGRLLVRMFNPDGTEDFCGNGLRCSAKHAFEQGWVEADHAIEHFGRSLQARVNPDGLVRVELGLADYSPQAVPLDVTEHPGELVDEPVGPVVGTALTTGSTHLVVFVDRLPGDEEFHRVSPGLELHPLFPKRTSVTWVQPLGERELRLRIWERGACETMGCGTGSGAAAAAWFRKRGLSGEALVHNPGGDVLVSMAAWNAPVFVASHTKQTFAGTAELP